MKEASLQAPQAERTSPRTPGDAPPHLVHLQHLIDHAAHVLPAQGPITVFIHHNTLHAFEDLPFHDAVKKGMQAFGCHPYLTEDRYREELARGRIRFADLHILLAEDLGERSREAVAGLVTRLELRLAMLQYPLLTAPTGELLWFVAETDALRRVRPQASSAIRQRLVAETRRWAMRDLRGGNEALQNGLSKKRPVAGGPGALAGIFDRVSDSAVESWSAEDWEAFTLQTLWRVCCSGVSGVPPFTPVPPVPVRHRKLLLDATGMDSDLLVHEVLIRFCAAFLDQGLAPWKLPYRDDGFYLSFCTLYGLAGGPREAWLRGLDRELLRLQEEGVGPLASIHESLTLLGVAEEERADFIAFTLLALRGWTGMMRQIEVRGDRVVQPVAEGSLVEFLAIRLLLDRWALAYSARQAFGYTGPLSRLRDALRKPASGLAAGMRSGHEPPSIEQRAFLVFQLAQVLGWTPEELQRLNHQDWSTLLKEIEGFSRLERRRIFHLAYERRFNTQTLDAVALHAVKPAATPSQPRFQAVFCIDERGESIRRHLEELAADVETFSIAGFYFIPMYYRGAADAHFVPLCPAVMRPQYWIVEQVVEDLTESHRFRARTRRALGMAQHQFHLGSRGFALGAVLAAAVGVLASIPLVMRTLFPRLTARIRRRFGRIVQAPPVSRLLLERSQPTPGPGPGQIGLTVDEMTAIAERVLRDMGLVRGFSRIVLTIGHGSTSMNNPHESAHDCGACGGAGGGPNGRALAQILNDARIRERLSQRGLEIPPETFFVGGLHNTSSETITFYDVDCVPDSHRADFAAAQATMEAACDRDAHERSRRFLSAPLTLSFDAARLHVEGRAEDLAQVRPEWGHATNAISIIGRRAWTRGLFLDRRAFLTSYDPTQDDAQGTILTRILQVVLPVCAGINLEYYFSYVDNTGWGCGTKLPHNIASLVGVMDGAASDLRTGLPWQMVEIHEPVRLLNIIETTPETMLGILERQPSIGRLCRNSWVHLAVLHPQTRRVSLFHHGSFQVYQPRATQLPRAASSVDWYRGWRDHLEFAAIGP
jgi:uncharacterized protein YbcC (UPF0753/DUF2309 family)